ncbi:hypothetical protein [Deinococcus ruber]|uniref:Uncharacterized protein n=1 Tax=Deinococcus ruber TaxID=1848197 RepID=A0A918CDZ0_9DEIO|nr:hypothetical protein [Deinococcus ruber]GGR17385.1 hypothetical protein GCM10008957_32570 [Deinococcus ruber]
MLKQLLVMGALGSALLGSVVDAASPWNVYVPDALPPLVQDAYPSSAVKLMQAQQSGPLDPSRLRGLVETAATAWVGSAPHWFVRLTQDSSEGLAVSSNGLKVFAVRISGAQALAFELTLKTPLPPSRTFTAIPTADALWTRTLPVTQLGFSTAPCPEGIELGSLGITITMPANFPLPGGRKLVQDVQCQGLELHADGGTSKLAGRITVRAATWQQAWAVVAPSDMVKTLLPGAFTLINGTATILSRSSTLAALPNDVIAVQNGGHLQPLLFQKTLTPWQLLDGENRFYLHVAGPSWEFISVDTRSAVVTLIRSYPMPAP